MGAICGTIVLCWFLLSLTSSKSQPFFPFWQLILHVLWSEEIMYELNHFSVLFFINLELIHFWLLFLWLYIWNLIRVCVHTLSFSKVLYLWQKYIIKILNSKTVYSSMQYTLYTFIYVSTIFVSVPVWWPNFDLHRNPHRYDKCGCYGNFLTYLYKFKLVCVMHSNE